jgi:hypothetical protein
MRKAEAVGNKKKMQVVYLRLNNFLPRITIQGGSDKSGIFFFLLF